MSDSEKPKSWQERSQSIKHKWLVPFIFAEWLCEWFSYILGKWALLDICGHVGRFGVLVSIIVGVCVYVMEADERRIQAENQQKAKHHQAWQVINSAYGKPGDGGRKDALEDLNKDGISLTGVDVSQAYLPQLDLQNAYLWKANFSKANLFGAKLSHAVLQDANLSDADVSDANLSGALFTEANLSKINLSNTNLIEAGLFFADVSEANLRGANLSKANFHGANLSHANLSGAYLSGADVSGANFYGADLSKANLWKSNLRGIKKWRDIKSIKQANIFGVENPPDGFIEWATKHGAANIEDDEGWKKWPRMKLTEKTKEKQ